MTQPFGDLPSVDALTKALGIMSLIEMIEHMSQVTAAFEIAGVFTPEGTKVLGDMTKKYFDQLNDLITAERDIFEAQKAQKES